MTISPTFGRHSLTLQKLLNQSAKLRATEQIITYDSAGCRRSSTYSQVQSRAHRLATALVGLGLKKGDRVGTLMVNHDTHFEAHFGVTEAGGVLHPISIRLHPSEIAFLITHAGTKFVLLDPSFHQLYEQVQGELVVRPTVLSSDKYEDVLSAAPPAAELSLTDERDAAVICYTGGTTGRPKGVVYSHKALVLHSLVAALPDVLSISRHDVVMTIAPFFHICGWTLPFSATMVGAKQILPGPHTSPTSLLDMMADEQVTFSVAVPTVWHGVLDALDGNPASWNLSPRLRVMTGGSAPSEALITGLRRHGIVMMQTWGMTETTAAATISSACSQSATEDPREIALQGTPVPFIELRVVRDGREMPWDDSASGELQVRGPWVTESYHDRVDMDAFSDDGWLRTGDVGTISPTGRLRLLDRSKDLIKSGGEWISSIALENAIMNHNGVAAAVVVAAPHPKWLERPFAFVVPRSGQSVDIDDLRNSLAAQFARWWIPDTFELTTEIPRTATGKWDRTKLREIARTRVGTTSVPQRDITRHNEGDGP